MLCSALPPTLTPSLANAVLHEMVSAKRIGGCPLPHGAPASLYRRVWLPGNRYARGAGIAEFSFLTLPVLNAAELVISLKLEPGGNVALIARFSNGCAGSLTICLSTLLNFTGSSVARLLGSKLG